MRRYDRERESAQLALATQGAVAQAAASRAGALGLEALVVTLFTTRFLDVTGLIAAAVLAGYGLFVLPNRRRKAQADFRKKTEALRERLVEILRRQFDTEIERSVERMREAIAPYTRFVCTEHARMTEARSALSEITAEAEALYAAIGAPGVESF